MSEYNRIADDSWKYWRAEPVDPSTALLALFAVADQEQDEAKVHEAIQHVAGYLGGDGEAGGKSYRHAKGNYFSECERDEHGRCKPQGGGGASKPQGGEGGNKPYRQSRQSRRRAERQSRGRGKPQVKPRTTVAGRLKQAAGKAREAAGKIALKAGDVVRASKELAKKMGEKAWSKVPKPLQKGMAVTYSVGTNLAHTLEIAYPYGQEFARQIAKEHGLSDKHVERVGKWVSRIDTLFQWGINWQVAEHVCSHLGIHGLSALGVAKGSSLIPAGSLAFVGAAALVEGVNWARGKKDPFKMIRAARNVHAAVKARHAHHEHKTYRMYMKMKDHTEAVARLLATFEKMSDDQADWFEYLLATALDSTKGNLGEALDLADAAFEEQPTPPEENEGE